MAECLEAEHDIACSTPTLNSNFYRDSDGDGRGSYMDISSYVSSAPSGYVKDFSDCNDVDYNVHFGATEFCDGKDNDCDGQADEGCTACPSGSARKFECKAKSTSTGGVCNCEGRTFGQYLVDEGICELYGDCQTYSLTIDQGVCESYPECDWTGDMYIDTCLGYNQYDCDLNFNRCKSTYECRPLCIHPEFPDPATGQCKSPDEPCTLPEVWDTTRNKCVAGFTSCDRGGYLYGSGFYCWFKGALNNWQHYNRTETVSPIRSFP